MFAAVKKYSYLWVPILSGVAGLLLLMQGLLSCDREVASSIANISGVFAGFLFTGYAIFLGLPSENSFVKSLNYYGYCRLFYRHITFAIGFFVASMIFALTRIPISVPVFLFFAGIGNSVCAFYILAQSVSGTYSS